MVNGFKRIRNVWFRYTHWEFWPFGLLYFPVYFYYLWLSLKARSFFFFTAANPTIDFGGMLGESKADIFKLIPEKYLPVFQLIAPGDLQTALAFAEKTGFPLIGKPDIGERGKLVEKLADPEALKKYIDKCPVPFLLQEYIDLPIELGVFYTRFPGERNGRITSIVKKEFLKVRGNGRDGVKILLKKDSRALLQVDFDHPRFAEVLRYIPGDQEEVLVEPIGNHCRGTIFLDQTSLADEQLTAAFDKLANQIEGFYFGRFDLRCSSMDELKELKDFKILELNGAGSEPGHIYQPGYSLQKGYAAIFWHLKVLAEISRANKARGFIYWGFGKGMRKLQMIRSYNKSIKNIK